MDTNRTLLALDALAQRTRFEAVDLLLRHEPDGLSAGEVARNLKVPQNTMSNHLRTLTRAGLIKSERHSRNIIYRVERDYLTASLSDLLEHYRGAAHTKRRGRRTP